MADTSRERTGEFVQKLFQILMAHPEGLAAKDALEKLEGKLTLSGYEAGYYEASGVRRFEKLVRFATVDCVKAGWMLKQKGTWYLTDEGLKAYHTFSNPGDLYREATRLYRAWKLGQKVDTEVSKLSQEPEEEKTAQEKSSVTFEEAEDQARTEIEEYLRAFNPYEFQQLVADLVSAMNYHVTWIAPPGKDGGVDIIAHTDPLGTKPPRIKIQVKRNSDSDRINVDGVRAFVALIGEDDVGLYVAAGGFTKDAEDFARSQERRKLTLINLAKFVNLWIDNYRNLTDVARQRLPLRPIHFLALDV